MILSDDEVRNEIKNLIEEIKHGKNSTKTSLYISTGYPLKYDLINRWFARMVEILDFVENSPCPVIPCDIFYPMKEAIEKNSFLYQGGLWMWFWFLYEEDALLFYSMFNTTIGDTQSCWIDNPIRLPNNWKEIIK